MIESKVLVELPEGLAEMPPGPVLAAVLASVDRARLSGFDLVVLLQARSRQLAYEQAELAADMVAVADAVKTEAAGLSFVWDSDVEPLAAAEIATAVCETRRSALSELRQSELLVLRLPGVWAAMREGRISDRKARVLIYGTQALDEGLARRLTDRLLPEAPDLTSGQLAYRLRRLIAERDPDGAAKSYARGVSERKVVRGLNADGTAYLSGCNLPVEQAAAADERLDALARAAKQAGDDRPIDVIRADIYLGLLAGTYAGPGPIGRRGVVELTADLPTLLGLADHVGELAGWGAVVADIARKIADQRAHDDQTVWRYSITHPLTGALLYHGTTHPPEQPADRPGNRRRRDPRRFPTPRQRAFVHARDRTCTGPGCRVPARRTEIDHRTDWADGGPTQINNLDCKCAACHRLKHTGWNVTHNHWGDATWTSPLGHTHRAPARPITPPRRLSIIETHLLNTLRMRR